MTAALRLFCVLGSVWTAAAAPEFNRDIRPILSDRCFACHGPDAGNRKANLRLDVEAAAKADLGKGRFPIVPGDAGRSEVYKRVTSANKALRMPPAYAGHDRLPDRDIELLRAWIEAGAPWQQHWSFLPPRKSALPATRTAGWARHALDHFVLARLEREGLKPAPEADAATLVRRVTLDLTGLPPAPEEVDRFVRDPSEPAYEKLVDRLLDSPRYAERMAIRWLEAARYADTNGYQTDGVRTMWPWRDWVIDAFRRNLPFDQFTVEQIAGDLLPDATLDQKIATGFHRNHRTSAEGGIIDEEFRVEYLADRVETTSTVWLGLTMGCTRCHDHKYDPILQKDFYRMFAFYNNTPERGFVYNFGNEEPYIKAPTAEQAGKLAALDARAAEAGSRWKSLDGRLQQEQRRWEKRIRKSKPEWQIGEGLDIAHSAEDKNFDGTRAVDLGKEKGAFNHRDPYTISAWFQAAPGAGPSRQTILSRMDDYFEGSGWGIFLIDGKLRFHYIFRWTDLGMRMQTARTVTPGEWHHVAVTYDGSMKAAGGHTKIYLDGVEQPLEILFDQNLWPLEHKASLRLGAGGGDEMRFHGKVDGVRIYRREMTADEVAVLHSREPLAALAAIRPEQRNKVQAGKLRLAFLDQLPADLRRAREDWLQAKAERERFYATVPTTMVMVENAAPRDTFVLRRGAYDAHGEKVTAGVPAFLPQLAEGAPANRLGLALWLVSRDNPLTARVTVNRYWQMLFGIGLVKTVEDFGSQGEWPTHPELLDWLAVDFVESGWNVKRLLKTIVMSATYRQSSRVTPDLLQRDPENRLLARGARYRLPAEMIRDQALAVSGLLAEQVGGPPVKPYQPPGLWQELAGGGGYQPDTGASLYRRSLYSYWRRTIAPPAMVTFDSPTRENCIVRETRTNTPLQALTLMNDVTYVEAARQLAARMLGEGGTTAEARIRHGFRLAVARAPRPAEEKPLLGLLERLERRYAADPQAAAGLLQQGDSKADSRYAAAELAAYTGVASLLLNMDETVTRE